MSSAAKIPAIRARMRQQEILTLRLAGPAPVVSRRIDHSNRNTVARHVIRGTSLVVIPGHRSKSVRRSLWQRVGGAIQSLARRIAHIDAPGVTF